MFYRGKNKRLSIFMGSTVLAMENPINMLRVIFFPTDPKPDSFCNIWIINFLVSKSNGF